MRKITHIFLSLVIVYASTVSAYANTSIGGWTLTDSIIAGANTTINAVKGSGANAVKSVVAIAPQAGKVGKILIKGGAAGALALAVPQLIGDGVEWVLDPANNSVKYKPVTGYGDYFVTNGSCSTAASSAAASCAIASSTFNVGGLSVGDYSGFPTCENNNTRYYVTQKSCEIPVTGLDAQGYKHISIDTVASKVISNASAGHVPSQDAVKSAAIDSFSAGEQDAALNANAVPLSADDPQNPPIVDPNNPPQVPPFDPSSIIAAIKSVMNAIVSMSSSITAKFAEMIGLQQETNQVINDGMADVVAANNATGAKVGEVVAAIEALEGNTLDGKVINDAIDKAIAAGHTDTASIVAAIEAIEGNTLDADVINEAVDRVIENDKAIAEKVAAEKVAADKAVADQFEELPPEKPQSETDVPVDLPPEVKNASEFDVDYVSFGGQCPVLSPFSIDILGSSSSMTFDMSPLCNLAVTIRPAIIAIAYFIGLGIIASAIRES